jgi:hypothetical protein
VKGALDFHAECLCVRNAVVAHDVPKPRAIAMQAGFTNAIFTAGLLDHRQLKFARFAGTVEVAQG